MAVDTWLLHIAHYFQFWWVFFPLFLQFAAVASKVVVCIDTCMKKYIVKMKKFSDFSVFVYVFLSSLESTRHVQIHVHVMKGRRGYIRNFSFIKDSVTPLDPPKNKKFFKHTQLIMHPFLGHLKIYNFILYSKANCSYSLQP